MVHYNAQSSSSATHAFVLGVFLTVTPGNVPLTNNSFFNNFFGPFGYLADNITLSHDIERAPAVNPYAQLLPSNHGVYSYSGSLTTPPCTTGVSWFVFDEAVPISPGDLHVLRQATSLHPNNLLSQVGNNNRGYTVPLAGRTLSYTTGVAFSPTLSPTQNTQTQLGSAALVLGAIGTTLSIITLFAVVALFFVGGFGIVAKNADKQFNSNENNNNNNDNSQLRSNEIQMNPMPKV